MDTDLIPIGSRWREVATGRVICIASPGPNSPWWFHEDDPDRQWTHCSLHDFFTWKRFVRIS